MSALTDFITRWKAPGGSEQVNAQLFLTELCDALDLPRPAPARPVNEENSYSFERKGAVARRRRIRDEAAGFVPQDLFCAGVQAGQKKYDFIPSIFIF